MGVGGYLSAQAERDHFRYQLKSTRVSLPPYTRLPSPRRVKKADWLFLLQERVGRSCAGEMEREVSAILSPLGIDDSLSRRVAGALLAVEATLPIPPPPPSIAQQILRTLARRPRFSASGSGGEGPDERAPLVPKAEEQDERGLTAFLLKFGEGMEEVGDGRLFVSAFTIGAACEWPSTGDGRQRRKLIDRPSQTSSGASFRFCRISSSPQRGELSCTSLCCRCRA